MSFTQPVAMDNTSLVGSTSIIKLSLIDPSPFNPRKEFDKSDIYDLGEAIKAQGLLQSLIVRPKKGGRFELMGGERRFRALKMIAAAEAKCNVIEADDGQALAVQIVENLQRQDLKPLEEAEAFAQLQKQDPVKWTAQEIAKAVGKTDRFVQQRLALTRLAPEARKALEKGDLNVEAARVLATAPAALQKEIVTDRPSWNPLKAMKVEDIRGEMRRQAVPVSVAAFDRKLYDGPYIEDDNYFADVEQFDRLQSAAAQARLEELRKEWPAAEMHTGNALRHWVWADTGDNLSWNANRKGGKATGTLKVKKDQATALVWIDTRDKQLVVCIGVCKAALLESKQRTPSAFGPKPESETHKAGRLAYNTALRAAIVKKPNEARRIAVLYLLANITNGDLTDEAEAELKISLPETLRKFLAPGFWVSDFAKALEALNRLKPAQVDDALARLAVSQIEWDERETKPAPHVAALASSFGVKFVEPKPEPPKGPAAKEAALPKAKTKKPVAKKPAAKKAARK